MKPTHSSFVFARMSVEYVDCKLHEELINDMNDVMSVYSNNEEQIDPAMLDHKKALMERKQKYLLVNEWNEEVFAKKAESEE
jgi:hypothetical protein